jgi:uncharacterized membrane protein YccF (DUF307 family)
MSVIRAIGNILWLVLAGWWLALAYAIAALVMFILIITIPFGIQALKLAGFVIWPFGRTVVDDPDADDRQGASVVGNVLWVLLAGWELALAHIVAGAMLCLTIIGIPFGVASFKMVPLAFVPFGRTVVSTEEADRLDQQALVTIG